MKFRIIERFDDFRYCLQTSLSCSNFWIDITCSDSIEDIQDECLHHTGMAITIPKTPEFNVLCEFETLSMIGER